MSHVPDVGTAAAVPSRAALLDAMALNARRGHENMGPLSESHGFSPMLTPCTRLPEEFKVLRGLLLLQTPCAVYCCCSTPCAAYCCQHLP